MPQRHGKPIGLANPVIADQFLDDRHDEMGDAGRHPHGKAGSISREKTGGNTLENRHRGILSALKARMRGAQFVGEATDGPRLLNSSGVGSAHQE